MGVLEASWAHRYGDHDSISRRQGRANLRRLEEMDEALGRAGALQMPVYLALNARCTAPQYPDLEALCRRFAEGGGTGVILRDLGLMARLQRLSLPLRYTASLLTVTVNADGVRFLASQGFDRVVLPRFLRRREIMDIARQVPEVEYEVMAMGDQCPMIDGFCSSFHGQAREPAPGLEVAGTLPTFDTACEAHHLCAGLRRAGDPCAACDLRAFSRAGIHIFKFGGRGTPLEARLRTLRFFSEARSAGDASSIRGRYREVFGHECHCYYA